MLHRRTLRDHLFSGTGGWLVATALLTAMLCDVTVAVAQDAANASAPTAPSARPAPPVETTSEPVGADAPTISIAGTVVNEQGAPVRLATVVLRAKIGGHLYVMALRSNRDVIARTRSDIAGHFRFEQVRVPSRLAAEIFAGRQESSVEVIAWSSGRGFAWRDVDPDRPEQEIRLTLAPEAKVEGTVRDADGKPLAGAKVAVTAATRATGAYNAVFRSAGDLNLTLSDVSFRTESDADGHFELAHLPAGYRLVTSVERIGAARDSFFIDTSGDKEIRELKAENGPRETVRVLRAPLDVVLKPQRYVTIRVTRDGAPVTSGGVHLIDAERHFAGVGPVDQEGVARVNLRGAGSFTVWYAADPFDPGMGGSLEFEVAENDDAPQVTLALATGRLLTGRVVDADTGAPIAGAYLIYRTTGEGLALPSQAVTDARGDFHLPVAVGDGDLSFAHPVYGYLAPTSNNRGMGPPTKTINVRESRPLEPITLRLPRGLAVRGVVRNADGKGIAGAIVHAQNTEQPFGQAKTTADAEGRFTLYGLMPQMVAIVTASSVEGSARLTIKADAKHPLEETRFVDAVLETGTAPVITGRIMRDGKPQAGVRIKLDGSLPGQLNRIAHYMETVTDAEGRYRVCGPVSGERYYLGIHPDDGATAPDFTHQMPYVQTVPAGKAIVVLPDANLVSTGQSLRGRVVDTKGNPVPGVTVSASLVGGHGASLSRSGTGSRPWTETDEAGRFEIVQLPDKPIELMAYRANPAGGVIRHPSRTRPAFNQQDIRILLDPTLDAEIEDLDAAPQNK
ncbi:MAG TPA: carboxypeptidase regulatory-like domain-containing protein [Pirellulales bacterium]|nr:carboxypeptidase regulatory-like domain-containing protein [Pirellulales bacterium]